MKKWIPILMVSLVAVMLFPATAFAHGHGHGHGHRGSVNRAVSDSYALCAVEDCNRTDNHRHGDIWCSGHYMGDGHEHHQVCSVSDCTLTGVHDHDGVTCFPHSDNDGHTYHSEYCVNGEGCPYHS